MSSIHMIDHLRALRQSRKAVSSAPPASAHLYPRIGILWAGILWAGILGAGLGACQKRTDPNRVAPVAAGTAIVVFLLVSAAFAIFG